MKIIAFLFIFLTIPNILSALDQTAKQLKIKKIKVSEGEPPLSALSQGDNGSTLESLHHVPQRELPSRGFWGRSLDAVYYGWAGLLSWVSRLWSKPSPTSSVKEGAKVDGPKTQASDVAEPQDNGVVEPQDNRAVEPQGNEAVNAVDEVYKAKLVEDLLLRESIRKTKPTPAGKGSSQKQEMVDRLNAQLGQRKAMEQDAIKSGLENLLTKQSSFFYSHFKYVYEQMRAGRDAFGEGIFLILEALQQLKTEKEWQNLKEILEARGTADRDVMTSSEVLAFIKDAKKMDAEVVLAKKTLHPNLKKLSPIQVLDPWLRKPVEITAEQRAQNPEKAKAIDEKNTAIERTDKVLQKLTQGGERLNANGNGPYAQDLQLLREFLDTKGELFVDNFYTMALKVVLVNRSSYGPAENSFFGELKGKILVALTKIDPADYQAFLDQYNSFLRIGVGAPSSALEFREGQRKLQMERMLLVQTLSRLKGQDQWADFNNKKQKEIADYQREIRAIVSVDVSANERKKLMARVRLINNLGKLVQEIQPRLDMKEVFDGARLMQE